MSDLPSASIVKALSLMDVMVEVEPLVGACVFSWLPYRHVGIRVMRLVCKDMATLTLGAVQSLSVQVGHGAVPNPFQMSRVIRNTLPLQLDITVVLRTGLGKWCDLQHLNLGVGAREICV